MMLDWSPEKRAARDKLHGVLLGARSHMQMHAESDEAFEEYEKFITLELWEEFVVNDLCGLCGNSGYIETRTHTFAGVDTSLHAAYCICPNGRALKRHHGK